jgi:hypothetical protein
MIGVQLGFLIEVAGSTAAAAMMSSLVLVGKKYNCIANWVTDTQRQMRKYKRSKMEGMQGSEQR